MPSRRRSPRGPAGVLAGVLVSAALAACTAQEPALRAPGAAVTADEAETLSLLLQRNYQRGGAEFVVTAPYAPGVVLTLTGEVDFRREQGRARWVTDRAGTGADDTGTLAFSGEELWIGDRPGLPAALRAAGVEGPAYVRRPLEAAGTADLVDVLLRAVLDLGRPGADDPRAFTEGGWTWQGERSIDSRLSSVFEGEAGASVAVDAADDLLVQYVAGLPGIEVTVTLAEHGPIRVALPGAAESADLAGHPELAAAVAF